MIKEALDKITFGRRYLNLVGKDSYIGIELTGQDTDELYADYIKSGKSFEDWARRRMPEKVFAELNVKITSVISIKDTEYLEDALTEILRKMGLKGTVNNPWGNDLTIEKGERCQEMNINKYLLEMGGCRL
jgi:hypothetical protein